MLGEQVGVLLVVNRVGQLLLGLVGLVVLAALLEQLDDLVLGDLDALGLLCWLEGGRAGSGRLRGRVVVATGLDRLGRPIELVVAL